MDFDSLPPRQKEVVKQIAKLSQEHGYPPTLAELASALGLRNRMTVHQHVVALKRKGVVQWEPGLNRSLRIVDAVSADSETPQTDFSVKAAKDNVARLPLAGTIAAGRPLDAVGSDDYLDIESGFAQSGCYALKIKGDSMIDDGIFDGDFVIVKPNPSPQNGEIVVVLLDDGSATLKRFYKEKGRFRLQPANQNMDPIIVDSANQLQIQGTVVGLFRKMS
jgi:repressor LexA